jgi:hypothetical protein
MALLTFLKFQTKNDRYNKSSLMTNSIYSQTPIGLVSQYLSFIAQLSLSRTHQPTSRVHTGPKKKREKKL